MLTTLEKAEVPIAFTAATLQYVRTPGASRVTLVDNVLAEVFATVLKVTLSTERCRMYPVTAEPPLSLDEVQRISMVEVEVFSDSKFTDTADGAVAAIEMLTVVDGSLAPKLVFAITR